MRGRRLRTLLAMGAHGQRCAGEREGGMHMQMRMCYPTPI
jgi:hypothetical protein